MKNVRIRIRESCGGSYWGVSIYEGNRQLMQGMWGCYDCKGSAIRNAKAMAKRIGIKYDLEIIKQHGC